MISQAPLIAAFFSLAFLVLASCEFEREGEQAVPQQFMGAETKLVAVDLVDVTVSIARPRPGALQAYADCVGSQYTLIRGMPYARRVSSDRTGLGDVLTDKVTFLLSPVAPRGNFVLNAREVVAKCKSAGVPTF